MAKSKVKAQLFMQYAASFDAAGGPAQLQQMGRGEFKDDSEIAQLQRKVIEMGNKITLADDVNIENASGQTPLDWAIYLGLSDVARAIIGAGGDINHVNRLEGAPYIKSLCARHHSTTSQVQLAIDLKADVNVGDHEGYSPITHAIWNQRDDLVRLLVEAKADIDRIQPKSGKSYLMELLSAEGNARDEHVVITVKNGANIHAEDEYGHRAAEWAVFRMFPKALESILEANGDINRANPKQSGLTYAAQLVYKIAENKMAQEQQLKFALDHNANANTKIGDDTIFSFAAKKKAPEVLKIIAAAPTFDVNSKIGGQTAFEFAMSTGNIELVKIIVSKPAFDPHSELASGLTPHVWAEAEGMDELVQTMDKFHPYDTSVAGGDAYGAAAGGEYHG